MHGEDGQPEDRPDVASDIGSVEAPSRAQNSSRRDLLRLSALGGAAIITIRPGMAQAAASVNMCTIAVPDAARSTKWVAADGSLVKANTKGAFAGPTSPLKAVDIKNSLTYSTSYPGYSSAQSTAYTNYIKKLTQGTAGFTCFASIQNPAH
jgi:hypothetical protein